MTVGQSPMFLLGLFFLTLSATHVFSVLSNTTSQFRLLSQWNNKDEELLKRYEIMIQRKLVPVLYSVLPLLILMGPSPVH